MPQIYYQEVLTKQKRNNISHPYYNISQKARMYTAVQIFEEIGI